MRYHQNISKADMCHFLSKYYENRVLRKRIQITYQHSYLNKSGIYYLHTNYPYKTFLKLTDSKVGELYKLDSDIVRYNKIDKEWFLSSKSKYIPRDELTKLRNVYLYLEFEHILIRFYKQTLLVKDVFIYMMCLYKNYIDLPPICYQVL